MNWILPILVFKAGLLISPEPYLSVADSQPDQYITTEEYVPYGGLTAGIALFDSVVNFEVDMDLYFGITAHQEYLIVPPLPESPYYTTDSSWPLAVLGSTNIYIDTGVLTAGWRYRINRDGPYQYDIGDNYGARHDVYIEVDVAEWIRK